MRGSLIDGHLVVEADDVLLGTGLPRQRVVGPAHLDVARRGLRHLEDSHAAGIRVTEEAGEAVQESELPVHGVSPLAPVHHNQGRVELVVESPRHLKSTQYMSLGLRQNLVPETNDFRCCTCFITHQVTGLTSIVPDLLSRFPD